MSYRVADKVNGFIGGVFQNEADARVVIEEIRAEGTENEVNWLLELVRATKDGGVVNIEDEGYVRRILSAPAGYRYKVAVECATERIYADCEIVSVIGE